MLKANQIREHHLLLLWIGLCENSITRKVYKLLEYNVDY